MSSLYYNYMSMMPVGYRFHPTDFELIDHYLKIKNQFGDDRRISNIKEIDLCKFEPWELPEYLGSESNDQEWYFFARRDPKYEKSARSNRATNHGYWKPTGKPRYIKVGSKNNVVVIGTKKTLVFHRGRGSKAKRTYWVMHEYCASADEHNPQAVVLYLLKKKTDESVEIPNTDYCSPYMEVDDDIAVNLQAFDGRFDEQQPAWGELDRMFHADVYPNQGLVHMTTRYLNVSTNDDSLTTHVAVPYGSDSSTETDKDAPQSLFGEDAVHCEPTYLSDAESSDQEFYNDIILAHEVSLSGNSEVIQHVELKADKEGHKKLVSLKGAGESDLQAQASVSDDSSEESLYEVKSGRIPEVGGNKSSDALGKKKGNMGFIVYAGNPRASNGTTPPSNYIMNIAIGVLLTVVITGEALFGLVI